MPVSLLVPNGTTTPSGLQLHSEYTQVYRVSYGNITVCDSV